MAAVDMFLKIEGTNFDGKSNIEIESFSWGMSNSGSARDGSGGGAGKVSFSDLSVMRKIDKSSPALFNACCTGQQLSSVSLSCYKQGTPQTSQADLFIKLKDCLVSSVQDGGSRHGDSFPTESVSFNFTKIEMDYKSSRTTVDLDAGSVIYVPDTSATP